MPALPFHLPSGFGTGAGPGAAVAGSWSAGYAAPLTVPAGTVPPPGTLSLPVPVSNTAGDWMVAVISWRQYPQGDTVWVSVGDDVHNWWDPLVQGSGSVTSASGVTRSAIWVAPAAKAAGTVMVGPTAPCASIACTIYDVSGMAPWVSTSAVHTHATGTSVTETLGAPSGSAVVFTVSGSDNLADTITLSAGGWSPVVSATASNGTDATSDLNCASAWQVTSGSATGTWNSTGSVDFSEVIGAALVSAPALGSASPHWPVTILETAPGGGYQTPPDQLTWTPLTAAYLKLDFTQGRQYETASLSTGEGTLLLDNPLGLLVPPGSGSYSGIDAGTPVRLRTAWQGGTGGSDPNGPGDVTPWYVPFSGNIERLPQTWDELLRGQVQATVNDAWFGVNYVPQPILTTELLNDNPYALWPATDAEGAQAASNLAPGNTLPLMLSRSKYGAGSAKEAFGGNSSALLGAQSTTTVQTNFRITQGGGMWGLTWGSNNPDFGTGYSLACTDTGFPSPSGGVTAESWFQTTTPFPYGPPEVPVPPSSCSVISLLNSSPVAGVLLSVLIGNTLSGTGPLQLATDNGNTIANISSGTDYRVNSAVTHVAVTFTRTAWTSYVNGAVTNSGSFSPQLPDFTIVTVNGINGSPSNTYAGTAPADFFMPFSGYSGFAAIFPRILPQQRILTHYEAGIAAMAGEAASNRIERLLQAGNATGRRVILQETQTADLASAPDAVVSCQDIPGQPASQSVSNITGATLPSMFTIAPTGDLSWLPKQSAWNQAVKWTLGENVAGGQIPFEGDITFDYDPSRIQNEIQLTQLDDQSDTVPSVAAVETASRAQYGTISNQATGYLQGDATSAYDFGPGLLDEANWLANTYNKPRLRLTKVTVNAATNPASWPFVLGAAAGDMVTATQTAIGSDGVVISVTGRITQTNRSFQFSTAGVTGSVDCIIDPAPEELALTADDMVRGVLNGQNVMAW